MGVSWAVMSWVPACTLVQLQRYILISKRGQPISLAASVWSRGYVWKNKMADKSVILLKTLNLKPLHTIGKVSVNASIHKAITHYW